MSHAEKKQCVAQRPNIVIILPAHSHELTKTLNRLGEIADFRIFSRDYDFDQDTSFPDKNVTALAFLGPTPQLVDACISRFTPNARWIHSFSAGVDSMIGPGLQARTDIVVTNAKGAFSESLAEFALFGIMYFAKMLPHTLKIYGERKWERFHPTLVKGQTLGIVGYGNIGEHVAKMAKIGFGMKVLAVKRDPAQVSTEARAWVDEVSGDVEDVLGRCDYVVGILPGTASTKHYFNEDKFQMMKNSAVFINLGRGITASTTGLVSALQKGTIAGAVLDVQEHEPLPADSPLYDVGHEKLLLTPHCADLTSSYLVDTAAIFLSHVQRWGQGEPFAAAEVVNTHLGY